jgi:hypothetical protein
MMQLAMSRTGAALLRALLKRGGDQADRVLLTEIRSTDWQSLTFAGEQHRILLRIIGADPAATLARLTDDLDEHEFAIPGQIVASIAVAHAPIQAADGTLTVGIEALTISE